MITQKIIMRVSLYIYIYIYIYILHWFLYWFLFIYSVDWLLWVFSGPHSSISLWGNWEPFLLHGSHYWLLIRNDQGSMPMALKVNIIRSPDDQLVINICDWLASRHQPSDPVSRPSGKPSVNVTPWSVSSPSPEWRVTVKYVPFKLLLAHPGRNI